MAAELLEDYEHTFGELTFAISQRIQQIPKLTGGTDYLCLANTFVVADPPPAQKVTEINAAESDITEAERVIESMQLQGKSIGAKDNVKERIKGHETELKNLKRDLRKAKSTFGSVADREALLAGATMDDVEAMDHRTRLLHDVEKAESTSDVIDDMHQNLRLGIESGKATATELAKQRNLLERALDRVRNIKESLGTAKKLMNLMWRRMLENKLIMVGIIILLLILIGLVVYVKFFAGAASPAPAPAPSPPPPSMPPASSPAPTPATAGATSAAATGASTGVTSAAR